MDSLTNGFLAVVEGIMDSEREIDTKTKSLGGGAPWNNKTAAEMARYQGTRAKIEGESEEDFSRIREWPIDCHIA